MNNTAYTYWVGVLTKFVFGVFAFSLAQLNAQFLPDTAFESEALVRDDWSGTTQALLPDPWDNCLKWGTPNLIVDGNSSTGDFMAIEGRAHVNLICRLDSTTEQISTPLLQPLLAGNTYAGFIHIAEIEIETGWPHSGPAMIRMWGGDTICHQGALLWESPGITHYNWRRYYFEFTPEADIHTLSLQCWYWNERLQGYLGVDWLRLQQGPWFDVDLGPDTAFCEGDSIFVVAAINTDEYIISWRKLEEPNRFFPNFFFLPVSEPGTYEATVYKWGLVKKDTIVVRVEKPPRFTLGPDTVWCREDHLPLEGPVIMGDFTYNWSTGDTTPFIVPNESGIYSLEASVWPGCSSTDAVEITLNDCRYLLEMPNVFSPNQDGINDVFQPMQYVGIEMPSWEIFDRWGRSVFQSNNLDQGWDGRISGQRAPTGVYFWAVRFRDPRGQMQVEKGQCALLR